MSGPSLQRAYLWGFSGPGGWRWSRAEPLSGSGGSPLLSGPRGAQSLQDFHPRARPQQACLPPPPPCRWDTLPWYPPVQVWAEGLTQVAQTAWQGQVSDPGSASSPAVASWGLKAGSEGAGTQENVHIGGCLSWKDQRAPCPPCPQERTRRPSHGGLVAGLGLACN